MNVLIRCKFYVLNKGLTLYKIKNNGKSVTSHSVSFLKFVLHRMKYSYTSFFFSYGWFEFQNCQFIFRNFIKGKNGGLCRRCF